MPNGARTGGTATGTAPDAAGGTEADASTVIFTCTHAATFGGTAEAETYTCGSGTFTVDASVTCPATAPVGNY